MYTETHNIEVVDLSSGVARTLLERPRCCPMPYAGLSWTPDGKKVVTAIETNDGSSRGLYSVAADGTGMTRLFDWAGAEHPSVSPDGTRIAFSSGYGPTGGYLGDPKLWTARLDGTDARRVVSPPLYTSATEARYAPDGARLLYVAYATPNSAGLWTHTLRIVNTDGTNDHALWPQPDTTQVADYMPSWNLDGQRIAYFSGPLTYGGDSKVIIRGLDGSIGTSVPGASDPSYAQPSKTGTDTSPPNVPASDAELLARYTPSLRYDAAETYYADGASTMTDNYVRGPRKNDTRGNYLKTSTGTVIAAADPALNYPDLSLDFLNVDSLGWYPGRTSGYSPSDRIDADNNYALDAQRLHTTLNADGTEKYGNKIYGRVKSYPDGSKVLQYWMFFYYNPKTYMGFGAHEGDWEMVQLRLDAGLEPIEAAYAQQGRRALRMDSCTAKLPRPTSRLRRGGFPRELLQLWLPLQRRRARHGWRDCRGMAHSDRCLGYAAVDAVGRPVGRKRREPWGPVAARRQVERSDRLGRGHRRLHGESDVLEAVCGTYRRAFERPLACRCASACEIHGSEVPPEQATAARRSLPRRQRRRL